MIMKIIIAAIVFIIAGCSNTEKPTAASVPQGDPVNVWNNSSYTVDLVLSDENHSDNSQTAHNIAPGKFWDLYIKQYSDSKPTLTASCNQNHVMKFRSVSFGQNWELYPYQGEWDLRIKSN